MKLLSRVPRRWLIVGGVNLLADLADILSTMTSPWTETNPLLRDALHHPVLRQILIGKASWDLTFAICVISLWYAVESINLRWLLDRAALIVITYTSYDLFHIAMENWFIHEGWYHP